MLTAQALARLAPRCKDPGLHAAALEHARLASTVNTTWRLAAFLGQVYVETAGFTRLEESLRYRSPERLDAVYGAVRGVTDARALIAAGPVAIARRVYANRLGNGNEASGDGWRFRGSGYLQITGRANYRELGKLVGIGLEADPDRAREPGTAARLAFAFWDNRNLSLLADGWQLTRITEAINGPAKLHNLARIKAANRALQTMTTPTPTPASTR